MPKPIIISGTSNLPLAQKIAAEVQTELSPVEITKFSDGETYLNLEFNAADQTVFVIQSGNDPVNDHLFELLDLLDALKRQPAARIVPVIPFYPYRRQERRVKPGEAVAGELVAKLIEAAGATDIVTLNLHTPVIKNFFHVPLHHLKAWDLILDYLKTSINTSVQNFAVLAPDEGSRRDSQILAHQLNLPLITAEKYRPEKDTAKIKNLSGDITGKNILIFDDEINTAGTVTEVAHALAEYQVKDIYLAVIHPVLSGPAISRLKESPFKEIIFTDSIQVPLKKMLPNFKIISSAPLFAQTIQKIS